MSRKKAARPLILVCLLALSSGLIGYSVARVKYQVGEFQVSELEVNEYSLGEQIGRDPKGNLQFVLAPTSELNQGAWVACVDPGVAISVMESSLLTATDAKKVAATKPAATKDPSKKPTAKAPASKKPAAKTPASKKPAEKPAPTKPAPGGKACPT